MWCNDPILTYLKAVGYNAIRLPKADVRPLQIITRTGKDLDRLGELPTLLIASPKVSLPGIKADVPAANVSGQRTGDLSVGVGLSILGSVLAAMGGTKLGLETKYRQAKYVAFEFQGVLADSVEIAELDQYLGAADVDPFSRHTAHLLESDELYVITATLKSKTFTVEAKASATKALEFSVPEIQQTVGANVKVTGQSESSSRLTYEGPIPLVFGFQAVRLFYDQDHYTAFKFLAPSEAALKSIPRPTNDGAERLTTNGVFLRLHDES